MAITITATAGSAQANSFASEAEAIAYAASRLNLGNWTTVVGESCSEDEKKALTEATRELDHLTYPGYRVDATQALSWPRAGVPNPDAPVAEPLGSLTGSPEYASDEIPRRLREATIELAFEFLRAGTKDLAAADTNQGVVRKKVDALETEWSPGARPEGLARFPRVLALLRPLLGVGGALSVIRS